MNLTKALTPHSLADTVSITITPDVFSMTVVAATGYCQTYAANVSKFVAAHPEHPARDPESQFYGDLIAARPTGDTLLFLTEVLITDWQLVDDDGEQIPYTPEFARDIFKGSEAGRVIASKLLRAAQVSQNFQVDLIVKN